MKNLLKRVCFGGLIWLASHSATSTEGINYFQKTEGRKVKDYSVSLSEPITEYKPKQGVLDSLSLKYLERNNFDVYQILRQNLYLRMKIERILEEQKREGERILRILIDNGDVGQ